MPLDGIFVILRPSYYRHNCMLDTLKLSILREVCYSAAHLVTRSLTDHQILVRLNAYAKSAVVLICPDLRNFPSSFVPFLC